MRENCAEPQQSTSKTMLPGRKLGRPRLNQARIEQNFDPMMHHETGEKIPENDGTVSVKN